MKKDDLTVGPMALHFRRLAIPAALGMLFATLYNVVDVYFAGRLSTEGASTSNPVASNNTRAGRKQNRRVEISSKE